jgi:acyl-CoA reductase-like NAD-dependent aldehyde dehydrogenase
MHASDAVAGGGNRPRILPVTNPRTGTIDLTIECASAAAMTTAAERLRAAQTRWASRSDQERAQALLQWAAAIDAEATQITGALIEDTGRRRLSQIETAGVAQLIRGWAARAPALLAQRRRTLQPTATPGIATSSLPVPYPLVGIISPWNFPLLLSLIDAVPALAAGCAALIKPSEITPRFIEPLLTATRKVPAVAEVLGLVTGDGATGAELIDRVDYICFTGSVPVGRKVAVAAAQAFIPASLELGGKDPMIVLASADPEHAAATALRASVLNTGQACQSIELVCISRHIAAPFLAALTAAADKVELNYPDIDHGDIGPFILGKQAAIVQAQIDDARAKGARVLSGGAVQRLGGGLYLRPTVITGLTADMDLMREETFGPVIPVIEFDTPADAVWLANQSRFGLSAAVLAGSVAEAEAVGAQLEVGAVSINDAGLTALMWDAEKSSFKDSGLGPSRMGDSGLLRFLRQRLLIRQSAAPRLLTDYAEAAAP